MRVTKNASGSCSNGSSQNTHERGCTCQDWQQRFADTVVLPGKGTAVLKQTPINPSCRMLTSPHAFRPTQEYESAYAVSHDACPPSAVSNLSIKIWIRRIHAIRMRCAHAFCIGVCVCVCVCARAPAFSLSYSRGSSLTAMSINFPIDSAHRALPVAHSLNAL